MKVTYRVLVSGMVGLALCGVTGTARAADQPTVKPAGATTSPMRSSAPQAVNAPQTMNAAGTITAIDLQATVPTVKLDLMDGKALALTLDRKASVIWRNSQVVAFDQLHVGERVKVRYFTKDGQLIVKSILLIPAVSQATPAAVAPQAPVNQAPTRTTTH